MSVNVHKDRIARNRTIAGARAGYSPQASRCRRKFLRFFPRGFRDETYLAWERDYKWKAHEQWKVLLDRPIWQSLLSDHKYEEIAKRAVRIESKTNLLFSFEKMALRDAVKTRAGAKAFAEGLYRFLHERGEPKAKFQKWCERVATLPRKQTRVLTWPVVTVFGFIAQPKEHIFLKPNVTRHAAQAYGYDFDYQSKPNWSTYSDLLRFAYMIRKDVRDVSPRDLIDIQSFIWVLGSDEYEE